MFAVIADVNVHALLWYLYPSLPSYPCRLHLVSTGAPRSIREGSIALGRSSELNKVVQTKGGMFARNPVLKAQAYMKHEKACNPGH